MTVFPEKQIPGAPRFASTTRPGRLAGVRLALWVIAHHPVQTFAILSARLTGKRLRARQKLAALVGIDHRLALPAEARPAPEPASALAAEGIDALPVERLDSATTPIVILLPVGHDLVAGAATAIARAFREEAGLQALYGDALVARMDGTLLPILRPAFDPDFARGVDDVGPVLALRRSCLDAVGCDLVAGAEAADLLLRIDARFGAGAVRHLPRLVSISSLPAEPAPMPPSSLILRSRSEADGSSGSLQGCFEARRDGGHLSMRTGGGNETPNAADPAVQEAHEPRRDARLAVVRADLARRGEAGARVSIGDDGILAVTHPLPEPPPLVTVIVPTRDRLDLLRPCLDSLAEHTDWPAKEILVCDNGSREPETLAFLRDCEVRGIARTIPCPGPFDFAGMNNRAAEAARGSLLAFVNNDVEAFQPDWLERMVREALRPEVGAVGARLLDGEGRIQHGGIVLGTGGGLATHGHRHFAGDAPGYLGALSATHRVSAVTAACLVVETQKFRAVGGFDAERFSVDFNDVDLCLRLNAAGYRTLLVPSAVLHHREAASRVRSPAAEARHRREIANLQTRWGPLLAQDPHYHPGFDPDLSTHARLRKGWTGMEPAEPRFVP